MKLAYVFFQAIHLDSLLSCGVRPDAKKLSAGFGVEILHNKMKVKFM